MVLTATEYAKIRNLLIHSNNRFSFEQLKIDFKEKINSQRVLEKTNSLAYLFKILEKRDALGPGHVTTLMRIIDKVDPDNREIKNVLYRREPNIVHVPRPADGNNNPPNNNQRVLPPVPTDVVENINELIKSKIGKKWEELARALGVQEGKIDDLQSQYRHRISKMVHEVLIYHKEKCGGNFERWRMELQQALDKARRKDLSEDIDEILANNYRNG